MGGGGGGGLSPSVVRGEGWVRCSCVRRMQIAKQVAVEWVWWRRQRRRRHQEKGGTGGTSACRCLLHADDERMQPNLQMMSVCTSVTRVRLHNVAVCGRLSSGAPHQLREDGGVTRLRTYDDHDCTSLTRSIRVCFCVGTTKNWFDCCFAIEVGGGGG
jgi:hypothetical protein